MVTATTASRSDDEVEGRQRICGDVEKIKNSKKNVI